MTDATELPKVIKSPLTDRDAVLTSTIPVSWLVNEYRKRFDYDPSHNFAHVSRVGIYECGTGFRFYYPFSVAGDESLYRRLESFEWNYKEDKWEHDTALGRIRAGDKVLDVGCGEGNFLLKSQRKGAVPCGIELNRKAAEVAGRKGLRICEELLCDHKVAAPYDVVTSFQVLEHLVDPVGFMRDCIRVLRGGGTLVIGVPNNDAFIRLDPDNILNQPPHHMGLWNRASLSALADIVGLQLVGFEIEPLAETGWYQSVIERRYLHSWRRRLFYRLGYAAMLGRYIKENAHTIAGHTIMAIYRK